MVNTLNSKVGSVKDTPKQEHLSLISNEKLLELYSAMLKCRMLEQHAAELFQQGKLTSDFGGSEGYEASAASAAIDLTPGDVLCVRPGDWLPAFVKGMSPESLFSSLVSTGSTRASVAAEAEGNNILLTGDQSQQGRSVCERAADARAKRNGAIVAVFVPSGPALLEGWREVIASAANEKLPIVFVHHTSDGTEISIPSSSRRSRNPEAHFHGVPAISVDAADPVAIYRVAFEAIVRARQNRGATWLECTSVPRAAEADVVKERCQPWLVDPVSTMETYLRRKGIDPSQHERQIVEGFHRELDLATRFLDR